ncbi:XRE family transcriptional regulator [Streptomyces sp. JJ66]|uniref:XRE family transcriptional regulator n=1 Tax=Streptomyces sp. JJ66 TaxID=2803843 RepID=UPI001C57D436|nr:XRE family transcriptional regulator [Streptomyces sp. JJ66]MBW1603450.1 XRE family transcriptional regulator [Streptomyces sp. JJ66]
MTQNGIAIRALRRARGWNLRDLAQRTDLSHGYLSRVERGRVNASSDVLRRIAEVFEVPPADITRGDDVSADTTIAPPPVRDVPHPATTEGAYFHYTPEEAALFLPLSARKLRERVYKREIPFSSINVGIHFTGLDIREITEQYRVRPLAETKGSKARVKRAA